MAFESFCAECVVVVSFCNGHTRGNVRSVARYLDGYLAGDTVAGCAEADIMGKGGDVYRLCLTGI